MLLEECKSQFNAADLYEVLQVANTATASEIKKAYYKCSMKWHPDKASDSEDAKQKATTRFQLISKVYEILSDKEKRAVYDETGIVDEENVLSDEESYNMWRTVFKKVTAEDIEKFCAEYKDSADERSDIEDAYNKSDGDMGKIMDQIMGSSFEDEDRIKGIIEELIEEGRLKQTKKFKATTTKAKTASRRKAATKEAKEAEEEMENIKKKEGSSDLQALILKRQADRGQGADSFFDSLAAKYAPKGKKGKK